MSDLDTNRNANTAGETQEPEQETTARFKRDELVRGWREYEANMPRVIPLLKYAAKTDMGQVRENNEDKFDYYEPEVPAILAARGSLFAVGDGIGGALAGQIASEMMLKTLISTYYDHPSGDLETALREAIAQTNDKVYTVAQMIPERAGMGTTLTAAIFIEDKVVLAQVGDSRAYLIRDNAPRQVTRDHSWVEEQVRAGVLSRNDAEMSPFRNVITRSIGAAATIQPDFYVEQTRVGDIWILCSDGLSGHVHEEEMTRIVTRHAPSEAARQLIELANAHGGRDNITVFVISVRDMLAVAPHALPNQAVVENGRAGTEPAAESPDAPPSFFDTPPPPPKLAAAVETGSLRAAPDEKGRSGWRKLFGRG